MFIFLLGIEFIVKVVMFNSSIDWIFIIAFTILTVLLCYLVDFMNYDKRNRI